MRKLTLASAAAVLGLVALAFGLPKAVKEFNTFYKVKKTTALGKASCAACHVGKTKKLNAYGADLAKAGGSTAAGFKAVQNLDSDKDGKKNLAEIRAGTLPGDPKSK